LQAGERIEPVKGNGKKFEIAKTGNIEK